MTRFGMQEADFGPLAELFAACVRDDKNVAAEVAAYRQKFSEKRYCLPLPEASELAARILTSAFPSSDYAKLFAENLGRLS
jgi:hypothetical protein